MAPATVSIVDAEKSKQKAESKTERAQARPGAQEEAHPGSFISYGVVYVNELAREAMMGAREPRFPVGSIIVREKLSTPESTEPQLLSIMIKREKGYDRAGGDWEFIVADNPEGKLRRLEKKINCLSCHGAQSGNDYVFRTYLPEKFRVGQKQ